MISGKEESKKKRLGIDEHKTCRSGKCARDNPDKVGEATLERGGRVLL